MNNKAQTDALDNELEIFDSNLKKVKSSKLLEVNDRY